MWLAVVVAATMVAASAAASEDECGPKCIERFEKMAALRAEHSVIAITPSLYNDLLRTAPRNYTVALLLNAVNPQRNCGPCQSVTASSDIVAAIVAVIVIVIMMIITIVMVIMIIVMIVIVIICYS